MKNQMLYPMVFYVFYIFFLAVYMFRVRVKAIKRKEVRYQYFQTYNGQSPQDSTLVAGRHFDNQFQVPLLFFSVGALVIALEQVSSVMIGLGWLFVLSRLVHSYVHLGSNDLRKRVAAYSAGWLILLIMCGLLVIKP